MSVTRKAAMFPDSTPEPDDDSQYLPYYTYVSGLTAHPHRSAKPPLQRPTSSGEQDEEKPFVDTSLIPIWKQGARLFQHGYYWEAHEAWEHDWITLGRCGPLADFTKALIKLAACGVKCLEQNPAGAKRHALRSIQLLHQLGEAPASDLPSQFPSPHLRNELEVFARTIADCLPIATEEQRQQARHGGVPVLGPLPIRF